MEVGHCHRQKGASAAPRVPVECAVGLSKPQQERVFQGRVMVRSKGKGQHCFLIPELETVFGLILPLLYPLPNIKGSYPTLFRY